MSTLLLTIEVPISSALSDERLLPKVVAALQSDDVLRFAVSRAVHKAKRRQDAVTIGPDRVDWKGTGA